MKGKCQVFEGVNSDLCSLGRAACRMDEIQKHDDQ